MRPIWNRPTKLLFVLAIAAVAATLAIGQVRNAAAARRDQQLVARMTEKMKTVCIGSVLVDLPQETRLELRGPRIHGLDISSVDEPEAYFRGRLAQREAELRATPDQFGGDKNLESVREVKTDNGVVGKIFVHAYTVTAGARNRGLELERYRDQGVAIEAMVHGKSMSFAVAAGDYDPDKIEDLPRLVARLVPNPHNQIATEPGFCIDRAWFRDPLTASQREHVMMSARLPSHPDIEFLIMLAAGNKPSEQSLLERSAAVDAKLLIFDKMHVSNLRASPRVIGGISGDELVTRFSEKNDATAYTFWWEVNGTVNNVLIPHFSFTMETGKGGSGPVPSSLSQDAAMAPSDKSSSSIHFHSPDPKKRAHPASPPAKA